MSDWFPWSEIWDNMFRLHGASVGEKILRPVVVYLALVILLRAFGKRGLAQLNLFDLIVILTLSNAVQNAIIGSDNSTLGGIIGAFVLVSVDWFLSKLAFHSDFVDKLVNGDAFLLIKGGKTRPGAMKQLMLHPRQQIGVIRRQGIKRLEDVDEMWLETSGTVSVLKKEPSPSDEERFDELIKRLDRIEKKLESRIGS